MKGFDLVGSDWRFPGVRRAVLNSEVPLSHRA